MGKLKDLVPSLEMCKLIPAGAFEDSAFCWCEYNSQEEGYVRNGWRSTQDIDDDFIVAPRFSAEKNTFCHRENFKITRNGWHCPAPTTDEILAELAKFPHYFNNATLEIDKDAFIVGAFKPNRGNPGSHLTENRDARPVVAALRLYLGLSDPSEASDGADTKAVASNETPDTGHKEVEQ